MKIDRHGVRIEIDPRLVEESVLLAAEGAAPEDRRSFRAERDRLYEIPPGDEREMRFRSLHGAWFTRLRLGDAVLDAISERSEALHAASRALILLAVSSKDEGADLHDDRSPGEAPGAPRPVLVVRVRPGRLLDKKALLPFLGRELLHIADMLDPEFGYSREMPALGGGPSHENLVRQRYQTLWDVTIDGRLQTHGLLPPGGEEHRREAFRASFPQRSPEAELWFGRYFRGARPTHGEMMRVAIEGIPGPPDGDGSAAGARVCSLCRLPSGALRALDAVRDSAAIAMIEADFPDWGSAKGLCAQCADLYDARSRESAPVVAPGSRVL